MTVIPSQAMSTQRSLLPFFGDGSACTHCADAGHHDAALRTHILHLLSLIENPDALPPEDALRIAGELLLWCDAQDLVRQPHTHEPGSTDTEKAA